VIKEEWNRFPFIVAEPFTFSVSDHSNRRKRIAKQLFPVQYPTISNSASFLQLLPQLFQLYDHWFFGGLIQHGRVTFQGN
jgi:hypothetical protein